MGTTSFSDIDRAVKDGDSPSERAGRLEHLLHPVARDDFLADYWEQRPLVLHRRDAGYYRDLFSLRTLDDILANSNVRSSVRVVKKGLSV
jgi:ribosomal protein L16 Arg81 hydroxylase